jgi:predicted transcriptional regulator
VHSGTLPGEQFRQGHSRSHSHWWNAMIENKVKKNVNIKRERKIVCKVFFFLQKEWKKKKTYEELGLQQELVKERALSYTQTW